MTTPVPRPKNPDEETHTTDPDGTQRLVGVDPGESGVPVERVQPGPPA